MTKILDGRALSLSLLDYLSSLPKGKRSPTIAFLLCGEDPASLTYVKAKKAQAERVGFTSLLFSFPSNATKEELFAIIAALNNNPAIDGILIQLPLPLHLPKRELLSAISPDKDVDGFLPVHAGKLLQGDFTGFLPCTPLGIAIILRAHQIPIQGKKVVIIGRSDIVGKPLAALFLQNHPLGNATVTLLHSHSQNILEETQRADILIVAAGRPHLIGPSMIKPGAIVVDVGIHRQNGRLIGDVDFAAVAPLCSYITPVPGGIGPMTIVSLLSNTYKSFFKREQGELFDPLLEQFGLPY